MPSFITGLFFHHDIVLFVFQFTHVQSLMNWKIRRKTDWINPFDDANQTDWIVNNANLMYIEEETNFSLPVWKSLMSPNPNLLSRLN